MRILHVISSIDPRKGGGTAAVAGMVDAQSAAGLETTLAATFTDDFDPRVADQLRSKGIRVELIGPERSRLSIRGPLKRVLHREISGADIVHIHALWEEIQHVAARLVLRANVPYIMTPHGMLDPWSLEQSALKKRLYLALRLRRDLNRAAALYFTTKTERDLAASLKLRPPAIIEPLGIDLSEFESLPQPGSFRSKHPKVAGRRIVLFLSRIHPKKGFDLLVPAFAQVSRKHRDAVLVIAGPDSPDNYRAVVERMIDASGIGERVIFTGMLHGRERIEAMVDADLFVLPSYQENFGIVVVESIAAGTPVVISDQVNMHDDVTRGEVGAVVPAEIEPLASELDRWLSDEGLRQAAAERCRPFAWSHYDWKQIGRRWREHYTRLRSEVSGQ